MEIRAGFWTRFVAFVIDGIIIGVISLIIGLIFGRSLNGVLSIVISLILSLIYYVWYQSLNGQTLGKRIMGIKVIKENGNQVHMGTMFLREIIGKFCSGVILYIGYIMAAGRKKRALHDYIAGTIVIRTE